MDTKSLIFAENRIDCCGDFKGEIRLKPKIHPKYQKTTVTCACGNSWETRSTTDELKLDICSACHPFFTGKQKLVDTAGRVERYRRKYGLDANNKPKNEAEKSN